MFLVTFFTTLSFSGALSNSASKASLSKNQRELLQYNTVQCNIILHNKILRFSKKNIRVKLKDMNMASKRKKIKHKTTEIARKTTLIFKDKQLISLLSGGCYFLLSAQHKTGPIAFILLLKRWSLNDCGKNTRNNVTI